ncbi:DNA cross-link repair 1A protein-like isoform X2 [Corticium candelabrum]|uniref:DNA cross-link repair 1A protein-like isoform X2 n=1 Tax=Corticium candelabrum TaxID=121492 RepID=UPI002E2568A7|nr:DNA cross-link repair 1A protein-like isoform X2 [Corticium candelabrum]
MFDPDDDNDFVPPKRLRVFAGTRSGLCGKRAKADRAARNWKAGIRRKKPVLVASTCTVSDRQMERSNENRSQLQLVPTRSGSETGITMKSTKSHDWEDSFNVVGASSCDVSNSDFFSQKHNIDDSGKAENLTIDTAVSDCKDDKFVFMSTTTVRGHMKKCYSGRAEAKTTEFHNGDVGLHKLLSDRHLGSQSVAGGRMDCEDRLKTKDGQVSSKMGKRSLVQSSLLSFLNSKQCNKQVHTTFSITASNSRDSEILSHSIKKCHPGTRMLVGRQHDSFLTRGSTSTRTCPFYKRVPGTNFTVDAFSYGIITDCTAYFLSHFHYDHYGGLKQGFKQPIYCSSPTANFVRTRLRVSTNYIHALPLNKPLTIEGITVCLFDANHCPGSVMFLFQLPNGKRYLHTGDIRATPQMEQYELLMNPRIDEVFLDTTYMDPYYCFPPQSDVIQFAVATAKEAVMINRKTLIVCGSYTIGKERIFVAIAQALHCSIGVTKEKLNILQCLENDELMSLVTEDWYSSRVHVLPMNSLSHVVCNNHVIT